MLAATVLRQHAALLAWKTGWAQCRGVTPDEDVFARWAAALPLASCVSSRCRGPTCTLVVAVQAARHAGEAWKAGLGGQDLDAAERHAPCKQVGLQPEATVQQQAAS